MSLRSEADAARPARKAAVRPLAEMRRPSTTPSAPAGRRSAISASSGSFRRLQGRSNTPSTQASSAPGRTICDRSLPAHQQVERVCEHRLTGPGLPGDRIEALAEAELGPLDQKQVLDPQLAEHARCLAPGGDGSFPLHSDRLSGSLLRGLRPEEVAGANEGETEDGRDK